MATTGDEGLDRLLVALHALGDERAGHLIEESWSRAESAVSEVLTEAMRAVLLRKVAAQLEGAEAPAERADAAAPVASEPSAAPADPPPAPSPPEEAAPSMAPQEEPVTYLRPPSAQEPEGWYVYAVVPAEGAERLAGGPGVDPDRRTAAIVHGRLAAIAGPVPLADFAPDALRERLGDQGWLAERVLAHEEVLRACVEAGPVVPLRFATIVTDEEAVRRFLAEFEPQLHDAIEGVRGRQEWGAKAYVDWSQMRVHVQAEEEPAGGGAEQPGAAYFSRKRDQRQGRARAQEAARQLARDCHERLSAVAERATLLALREPEEGDPQGESMLLNGAFLVADEAVEDFHALAEQLAGELGDAGVRIEVTGPWPPYSFTDLDATMAAG